MAVAPTPSGEDHLTGEKETPVIEANPVTPPILNPTKRSESSIVDQGDEIYSDTEYGGSDDGGEYQPSESDEPVDDGTPQVFIATTAPEGVTYNTFSRYSRQDPIRVMNNNLTIHDTIALGSHLRPNQRLRNLAETLTNMACISTDHREQQRVKAYEDGRDRINDNLIEPTYEEALKGKDRDKWIAAMEEEIRQMRKQSVFKEIRKEEVPTGKTPIGCKWVLVIKTTYDPQTGLRIIDRYRARLVAQGFTQRQGTDYFETHSPVMRLSTLRLLTAIAVKHRYSIKMFDVAVAYLNADIDTELYMRMPKGFDDKTHVFRLLKSIYGLKQAGLLWHNMLKDFLLSMGLKQSHGDRCLFYKRQNGNLLMIGVYVDDLIIIGLDKHIEQAASTIAKRFELRPLGEITKCLGIQYHYLSDGSRFIYQQKYVNELLTRFGKHLEGKHSVKLPIELSAIDVKRNSRNIINPRSIDEEPLDQIHFPYRELIGCLMYLVVATRPDISYSVSILARALSNPTKRHWENAIRLLCYLKRTDHYGILFSVKSNNTEVVGFSDAGDSSDPITEKCQTGVVFTLMGGSIIFYSNKQTLSKLHIHDGEQVALCEAVKDAIHIGYILDDLGLKDKDPTLIRTDSSVVEKRIVSDHHTHENRYVNKRYNFARHQHQEGNVFIKHIAGNENPADIFTKPLPEVTLRKHLHNIGMRCILRRAGELVIVHTEHEWDVAQRREKLAVIDRPQKKVKFNDK